jgi:hypothetical protein
MNESLSTSEFFILIGIHLCHVIIGSILIKIYLWETTLIRLETNFILYQLKPSLCVYQHAFLMPTPSILYITINILAFCRTALDFIILEFI